MLLLAVGREKSSFSYETFARNGHVRREPPCWKANNAVEPRKLNQGD